jgi:hypothetical protein
MALRAALTRLLEGSRSVTAFQRASRPQGHHGILPSWQHVPVTGEQALRSAAYAIAGLAALLAWSPVADRIATRLVTTPPPLRVFAGLQRSRSTLVLGIVIAWALSGVLEEVLLRGVIVRWLHNALPSAGHQVPAAAIGVVVAASLAYVPTCTRGHEPRSSFRNCR